MIGDVLVLTEMQNVPGDIILLKGQVVVDEASLTGESLPVVKNTMPNSTDQFSLEKFKNNVVFAGSNILVVNEDKNLDFALGLVYSTGFSSTKGDLFKTLLFPKSLHFQFYSDSWKFLGVLAVIGLIAFINRVIDQMKNGIPFWTTLLTSADILTIAVPPSLPLVLTVGVVLAVERLKKSKIFCIVPDKINFAGRINTMCWDKTGTLTSPTLKFSGVDSLVMGEFTGIQTAEFVNSDLILAMATCHSVNKVSFFH